MELPSYGAMELWLEHHHHSLAGERASRRIHVATFNIRNIRRREGEKATRKESKAGHQILAIFSARIEDDRQPIDTSRDTGTSRVWLSHRHAGETLDVVVQGAVRKKIMILCILWQKAMGYRNVGTTSTGVLIM